jgi:hypothetical protein
MREHTLASDLDLMTIGPVLARGGLDRLTLVTELEPGQMAPRSCLYNCVSYINQAHALCRKPVFRMRGVWVLYGLTHTPPNAVQSSYCFCVKLVGHVLVERIDSGRLFDVTQSIDSDPRLACIMCGDETDALLARVQSQCADQDDWFRHNPCFLSVGVLSNDLNDEAMTRATTMYVDHVDEMSRDGLRSNLQKHVFLDTPVRSIPFLQTVCQCGQVAHPFTVDMAPITCDLCAP